MDGGNKAEKLRTLIRLTGVSLKLREMEDKGQRAPVAVRP
jgi:hypothetical protein